MEILQIKECIGYTKDDAFKHLNFNPNHPLIKGTNCTQAWTQAGKPTPGTHQFKRFAISQLEEKTQLKPGYGLYITLDPAIPDLRKRPYTLINNKVTSTRQWTNINYMVVEAALSINNLPNKEVDIDGKEIDGEEITDITVVQKRGIHGIFESLYEAKQEMKMLTSLTHKDYIAMAVKIPDICPVASYCVYTPSASAKEGKFLAFGINAEL